MASQGNSSKHLKKTNTYSPEAIPKIEMEGTLPNLFYQASITMISKADKNPIKKENFRPIFLINMDEKFSPRY